MLLKANKYNIQLNECANNLLHIARHVAKHEIKLNLAN